MEKDFLTIQEVAPLLGYTERTVLDLIKSEKLKATKVGSRWHINPTDFDEFKKGHPVSGRAAARWGDIELGPHQRSLFFFGRCFRDYLYIDMPLTVIEQGQNKFATTSWRRKETSIMPQSIAEESVNAEWGYGNMDARQQLLFPYFEKHLKNHSCWDLLAKIEQARVPYWTSSNAIFDAIRKRVEEKLAAEAESDIDNLTMILLIDGFYKSTGSPGMNFDYTPDRTVDGKGWGLQLGSWRVGNKEAPEALKPIAAAHSSLGKKIYQWDSAKELAKTYRVLEEAMGNFQHSLSPDDLLRKFIIDGHCDLCPS